MLQHSESGIRSYERPTLETSALESLYGGQITLSFLFVKPNVLSKHGHGAPNTSDVL